MKLCCERMGLFVVVMLCMVALVPASAFAQSDGVVFWNKMETYSGGYLVSEIGPDLQLHGPDWDFEPAMFGDGWVNDSEYSFAYVNSVDVIPDVREGALAFWWVPDDNGSTGGLDKFSVFFCNSASSAPPDSWGFHFDYHHGLPSMQLSLWKTSASGDYHDVRLGSPDPAPGDWLSGDRVHFAFAWHNEPVILGEYIAALFIDGELYAGWTEPTHGTLGGWRDINPANPHNTTMRIGDSIGGYSIDEQINGPMDNVIFWNYAKEDFSDRFNESPLIEPVALDIKPGSCPNPLNLGSRGVVPAAILGTDSLEVSQIDPASLRLEGVAPIRSSLEDVATPVWPFTGKEHCLLDCDELGPDGFMDLTLKFKTQEIVAALGDVEDGVCRLMTLSGNLKEEFGGTKIVGEDVVVIKLRGGGGVKLGESRTSIRKSRTVNEDQDREVEDLQLRQ